MTVEGEKGKAPPEIHREDVLVYQERQRMRVTDWTPLSSDQRGVQLWILIDDGADTSLGAQLSDVRNFVREQPPATQVGIGYLRNGTVVAAQDLTGDHDRAARALRLPSGLTGIAASPYIALTDLIHKWPAVPQAREVLMISSGIDPYYGAGPGNPYLDRAIGAAQRAGVVVHSIYFGSAGHPGHSYWQINWGQNYLAQLGDQTGGEFYWQGASNPVSFAPFLDELNQRLKHQFLLVFLARPGNKPGFQQVRIRTEVPHATLTAPAKVYVPVR